MAPIGIRRIDEDDVAEFVGQPFRLFHGRLQGHVDRISGELTETGLVDHQLAHQIDQGVKLLGRNPDAVAFRRKLVRGDGPLLRQGRCQFGPWQLTAVYQEFSQPALAAKGIVKVADCDIAALDQNFPQARQRRIRIDNVVAGNVIDFDGADILDKGKDILDGIKAGRSGQQDIPREIATFRVGILKCGNVIE